MTPEPTAARLRLLHLSDVHAHLHPWEYHDDAPAPRVGLAAAAARIEALRDAAPNTLLFDGGDMLQGAAIGDMAAEAGPQAPHPVIAALNAIGVDAAGFGNHDFNYGLEMARAAAAQAEYPLLLANLIGPEGAPEAEDAPLFAPWAMLERRLICEDGGTAPIRIGVLGLCPPQVMLWDSAHLQGRARARDVVETAAEWIPRIRAAGADLVIALCHSGIAAGPHVPGAENAALGLAQLPGVDAILTGHQHMHLPGPDFAGIEGVDAARGRLHGVPCVMPGYRGEWVGRIDLALERGAEGGWRIAEAECGLERAAAIAPAPVGRREADRSPSPAPVAAVNDPGAAAPAPVRREPPPDSEAPALSRAVFEASAAAHRATLDRSREPAGRISSPLHSWFAMIADSPPVRLSNMAQKRWAAAALKGTPAGDLPLLSAAAPFRAGWKAGPGAFLAAPAGPLQRRHVQMLAPFPNALHVALIGGALLRLWLERAAAAWAPIAPGATDPILLDPEAPPYNFDVIDGVDWVADLRRTPLFDALGAPVPGGEGRVREIRIDGRDLRDSDRFAIVANGYRLGGGGNFPGMPAAELAPAAPVPAPDALLAHLRAAPVCDPTPAFGMRLEGLPRGGALLRTAPDAPVGAAAAALCGGLSVEDAGVDAAGFGLRRIRG